MSCVQGRTGLRLWQDCILLLHPTIYARCWGVLDVYAKASWTYTEWPCWVIRSHSGDMVRAITPCMCPQTAAMCAGEEWRVCSEQRVGLVRRAADGSVKGVPRCEPHRLQLAVSQLLDDMEEKEAIPDR